jgi:hypothetical protein
MNEQPRADGVQADAAEAGDGERMLTLLVAHLRQHSTRLRLEWATRIHDAHLLEATSPQERDRETASVYDSYVAVLEKGSVEASQRFARDLSARIIPRGVETQEILGIVLQLHDVVARSLFTWYQPDLGLLNRVLDAYEPIANRIATAVAFSCVDERARDQSAGVDPVIALEGARKEITTLNEALRTRTTIGKAIGLLMQDKTLSADNAFAHLVEVSSHTNVKIREIAALMVEEADARAERVGAGVQDAVAASRPEVGAMTSRSR